MRCVNCASRLPDGTRACDRCGSTLGAAPALASAAQLEAGWDPDGLLGRRVGGQYRVERCLAEGGSGSVYGGRDEQLGRRVAIKVLAPELAQSAQTASRFVREARAAASVDHRNVVSVYKFGEIGDRPFIVMEHIAGETLAERLRRGGALPPALACEYLAQVCDGLGAIHAKGFIHRDVKPHNIMVEEGGRCVLLDFGVLREVDRTLTRSGLLAGTPAYLAPEQASDASRVDLRSDLYAVGVTLFECLTARLPFTGKTTLALLLQHQSDPPPAVRTLAPLVPLSLDRLVTQLLAKDPAARPASADALGAALRAAARPGWSRGRIAAAAVVGAALLGVAAWVAASASAP